MKAKVIRIKRRLRKATVEGRVFTIRTLNRVIIAEKLFSILLMLGFVVVAGIGMHYCCDNDFTAIIFIVPAALVWIFNPYLRIPVLKWYFNTVDFILGQEVQNDQYEEYDRYYQYEDIEY